MIGRAVSGFGTAFLQPCSQILYLGLSKATDTDQSFATFS